MTHVYYNQIEEYHDALRSYCQMYVFVHCLVCRAQLCSALSFGFMVCFYLYLKMKR